MKKNVSLLKPLRVLLAAGLFLTSSLVMACSSHTQSSVDQTSNDTKSVSAKKQENVAAIKYSSDLRFRR